MSKVRITKIFIRCVKDFGFYFLGSGDRLKILSRSSLYD